MKTNYKTNQEYIRMFAEIYDKKKLVLAIIDNENDEVKSRDICKCKKTVGNIQFYSRGIIYKVVGKQKFREMMLTNFLDICKENNIEFLNFSNKENRYNKEEKLYDITFLNNRQYILFVQWLAENNYMETEDKEKLTKVPQYS